MKLVEVKPLDRILQKHIECYQFFDITGPLWVKAIPTGTLECWIKLSGDFEIFDPEKGRFCPAGSSGAFPIGRKGYLFHVPERTRCINVKLVPSVLGLPGFKDFIENWQSFTFDQFVGDEGARAIRALDIGNFKSLVGTLDDIISAHNDFESIDPRIAAVLASILTADRQSLKVKDLAMENHLTVKSLERLIKKMFGMTPKKLITILRFGNSIKYLNKNGRQRFIDALQFGYYDQSHFIRECKRITEMNPTTFLSELSLNTNDMIFSPDDPGSN